VWWRGPRCAV